MRKEWAILAVLIVVVFLAGVGVGYQAYEPRTITETRFEYVEVPVTKYVYVTEYQRHEIEQIAREVAIEHPYIYGVYDCEEFSHELVRRLEAKGYDADYVIGDVTFGGRHAWVKVTIYIEATRGYIISPRDFKADYRIRGTFER